MGLEGPLVAGVSVAAAALGGRYLIQAWQAFKARPAVPRMRRFYEGGFEQAMTRREAALILGVRIPQWTWIYLVIGAIDFVCHCTDGPEAKIHVKSKFIWEHAVMEKIKEAHRRVMVANHPDAGGSHYLASKINEAKDVLTGKTKGGGSAF